MAKESALGIRLELHEREALEQAADADQRSLSAMARKIIVEWIIAHGYLSERRLTPRTPGAMPATGSAAAD